MALTANSGPYVVWGNLEYLQSPPGNTPSPNYNQDAGPSWTYQGGAIPDLRALYQKDNMSGRTGMLPGPMDNPSLQSTNSIPAANGTATVAALANVTSGTAMTLVATNSIAAAVNIPIVPITSGQYVYNGSAPVTASLALDFGFAYATGTAASNTWTVADSSQWPVGTPLVIAGAGGSATVPLLTWVTGQPTTTTITTNDNCVSSVTAAPVGTGNLWLPREGVNVLYPTAHSPYRAAGIGAILDPVQTIARGLSVTGVSGGTGGTFTVLGWDVYGQVMHETLTAGAGAGTAYGVKAWKYILSVTPNFTDAHNYSIGTSDVFGHHFYSSDWESDDVVWAGATMNASTGWVAGLAFTTTPTATTADVRGTIQVSGIGGGSGIGSTQTNGTISSLARSGRRLYIAQCPRLQAFTIATPFNTAQAYGQAQF